MPDHLFKLFPSKQFISLIIVIVLSSLLITLSLPLSWWLKIAGSVLLLAYGFHVIGHHGLLKARHSISELKILGEGHVELCKSNQRVTAKIVGDSVVTGWVSVLRFRVENHVWPVSCVIFRDSLAPDRYRQLLVMLRMH